MVKLEIFICYNGLQYITYCGLNRCGGVTTPDLFCMFHATNCHWLLMSFLCLDVPRLPEEWFFFRLLMSFLCLDVPRLPEEWFFFRLLVSFLCLDVPRLPEEWFLLCSISPFLPVIWNKINKAYFIYSFTLANQHNTSGRNRMVVGFTITYAISAYHH